MQVKLHIIVSTLKNSRKYGGNRMLLYNRVIKAKGYIEGWDQNAVWHVKWSEQSCTSNYIYTSMHW